MKRRAMTCAVGALLMGAALSVCVTLVPDARAAAPGATPAGGAGGGGPAQPVQRVFVPLTGERTVVLGARTFLTTERQVGGRGGRAGGAAAGRGGRGQYPEGTTFEWVKASGPGAMTLTGGANQVTRAGFDQIGDYTVKFMAKAPDGTTFSEQDILVHVVPPAPTEVLTSIPTTNYSLDSTLWNGRIKAHIVSWIPHCANLIEHPENLPGTARGQPQGPGGLDNFIDAAARLRGQTGGRHRGYVFSNAWVHNIVESMCMANMVDAKGDAEILKAQADNRATLERWIPIILAAQEPDGYLQTAFTLSNRQRWTPQYRADHEGYVMGYFLESAIAHYYLTKGADMRLYDAAKKCADCWVANIGPEPGKKAWYDGHQEMEKALVRFGRLVNDVEGAGKGQKYIDLAKFLLDCRGNGSEYDQSHLPVIQQYEAVGHAVRAAYTYAGMAAVMADTHDPDYQSATLSIWDNIVNKKLYVTGGIGSGETSEGFGPNYSLRNNAYCESCSSCGELFFQYNMNLAYQDARYVSLYEDTIYNAILGNTNLEGTLLCYTNPLTGGNNRQVWQGCPCCVGNTPRALLALPTWTYSFGDNDLYVNLFIGSTMTVDKFMGTSVQMVQQTNYPWDGKVAITVNPREPKRFALKVAVPDRTVSKLYTLTPEVKGLNGLSVNGTAMASPTIEKGYAVIERDWRAGDKVEFTVPLAPQIVKCDSRVAANVGRLAIKYGPLVYNIEAVDGNTTTGGLAADAALSTEWRADLLGGVMVIKGKYSDGQDLLAIPNYARLNRTGQSMVWMPDSTGTAAGGGRGAGRGAGRGGAGVP